MNKKIFVILLVACLGISAGIFYTGTANAEWGDVVLNSKSTSMKKAGVKPVVFPHWFHRIRFKCKVCHEDIFIIKKGANDINMTRIMSGEFCGKCHNGLVAWAPLYCERCHSYTGSKPNAPTNEN
ncbi:MAG: c(7)-type cytochrome triheme domain-containing protein [Thermodesulfobacteriota bacterium]